MRLSLWASVTTLTVLAAGCGAPQPTTAGDKPVGYWVQTLQNPDAKARKKAASELGNVGAADPEVIPALVGALRDRDARVRGEAVLSLLKIGPAAREAVPALAQARQDPDAQVRAYAAKAIESIQGNK